MPNHGTVIQFPKRFTGHEPWLSKQQIADYLQYSVRWVELRVREGMPCQRFGSRLRFRISEVEAWLEQRDQQRTPRRPAGRR